MTTKTIANGTRRTIKGKPCVHYDGYWIRHYDYDSSKLSDKKRTIDKLTRRVFHHVEPGINTPGHRLDQVREIYEQETDPTKKRVKGAMLAGALLNRGRDILTRIVELEDSGVTIDTDNELFHMCSDCFAEALELGKHIKLANGHEGLDELWGEPFKAFSLPPREFYESRYIKLAQTMSEIDKITDRMLSICKLVAFLKPAKPLIKELSISTKLACETLRVDPNIYEVWPRYIAAKEKFEAFNPDLLEFQDTSKEIKYLDAIQMVREGGNLLGELSVVRVPMPKTVNEYLKRCDKLF